jgi:hypothetical protein
MARAHSAKGPGEAPERVDVPNPWDVLPPVEHCIIGRGDERRVYVCPTHGLLSPDDLTVELMCAHCHSQAALRFNIQVDASR